MEHRKDYGSPRDMLDDALLQRILADMTDNTAGDHPHCGCEQTGRTGRNSERDNRSGTGCGCGRNERTTERDDRSGTGCGCGRNERTAERDERSGAGCGYGKNERTAERDDRSGTGCGCGRSRVMPRQEVQNNGCPVQNRCVSGGNTAQLKGFPLAMVFSPNQEWEGIFEPEEALSRGTLFTGLVFPWYPSRCRETGGCGCGRD